MESYVVSCKYAEPQFPPCEEDYSNFSDQGGYYSNPPDSAAYGGGYPASVHPSPPPYGPSPAAYVQTPQGLEQAKTQPQPQPRPLLQHHAGHQRDFPAFTHSDPGGKDDAYVQCQAWMTCAKPGQGQRRAGREKPPIVVYPWMKKVHVAHGE
uniref:Homeobox protein D4 n=1 Tax=Knipowitschia caucasica TaxID=637954 RepID=A0AAV2JT88_KNICA